MTRRLLATHLLLCNVLLLLPGCDALRSAPEHFARAEQPADVKIQVEFDPAKVASWRLVGDENHVLAHSDFADDRKDAGEIGAGHFVTAMYEIVPTADAAPGLLMKVTLRYKDPSGDETRGLGFDITADDQPLAQRSNDFRFAAAVTEFGTLLRGSEHAGTAAWETTHALAKGTLGADANGRRAEFLGLVDRAHTPSAARG